MNNKMNKIDKTFLDNIIKCKYNGKFFNINSGNINILSSMKQTIFYNKKNYILNIKYRIFGSRRKINNITKKLDEIIDDISKYDIEEIALDLKSRKHNIILDKWINGIKCSQSKTYKIEFNKYDIFVYYYSNNKSLDKTFTKLQDIVNVFNSKNIIKYNIKREYKNYKKFINIIENPMYISIKNENTMLRKLLEVNKVLEVNKKVIKQYNNKIEITKFIKDNNIKNTLGKLRYELWYQYFKDNTIGNCFSCMVEIELDNPHWHCGHIISNYNGGPKTLENLHPICVKCNLDMKEQHMYRYMIFNDKKGIINLSEDIKIKYHKDNKKYKKILYMLDNINKEYKKMSIPSIKWFRMKLKMAEMEEISNMYIYIKSLNIKYNKKIPNMVSKRGNKLVDELHNNNKINKKVLDWFKLKLYNEKYTTLQYIKTL